MDWQPPMLLPLPSAPDAEHIWSVSLYVQPIHLSKHDTVSLSVTITFSFQYTNEPVYRSGSKENQQHVFQLHSPWHTARPGYHASSPSPHTTVKSFIKCQPHAQHSLVSLVTCSLTAAFILPHFLMNKANCLAKQDRSCFLVPHDAEQPIISCKENDSSSHKTQTILQNSAKHNSAYPMMQYRQSFCAGHRFEETIMASVYSGNGFAKERRHFAETMIA